MLSGNVSILILASNKAEYTQRCVDSLFLSTLRPFEVVLVDNGSTDSTPTVIEKFSARARTENISVKTHRFDSNVGAIAGRNRGMEMMSGAYWVFMDNDIVIRTRSWMEKLRAVLENNPRAAVAGPKLVYPLAPHKIQCAGGDVTKGGKVAFSGRGEERTDPRFNSRRECQTLISATWMMRADVAKKVGPLDDRFSPVQFEDIDYCYRIREAGHTCLYEPGVEMYHFENVTTSRGTLNYPYLTVKNGLRFKEKWKHRFSAENGPEDSAWSWANIETVSLADVPQNLQLID